MQAGLESLSRIPTGYAGTAKTISRMAAKVDQGKKNSRIISLASDIVANVPERDHRREVNAIFTWVQRNIRYVNDPYGVELVQSPMYTLQRKAGDCDDLSTITNALCGAIGYNTAFKTIKADPSYKNEFSHVYSLIDIDGSWIPADASQKTRPLGWEPPKYWDSEVWGQVEGQPRRMNISGLKGHSMLGRFMGKLLGSLGQPLDIKQGVINWLNRGSAPAAPDVRPATARPDTESYNSSYDADPPYDPEEHFFYNDLGNEGGGQFGTVRKERVFAGDDDRSVLVYTLPRVRTPIYSDYNDANLNEKFAGRQRFVDYEPQLNAVAHGTPILR